MANSVITAENISKRYRIGVRKQAKTFAGQLKNLATYPIDNFRKITQLTRFKDDDPSIFWALQNINFEVKEGEVLGIIGHNGAGKSTLLKILSRITEPTTGKIRIKGRVSALLEVGTGFHHELTGRDNVYMNGTILGMRKNEIDQKFDEIVAFSGIEKHIDTPVKFYSSGMTVRLAFSVAAHLEPEILIIDEVLAVGDAEFQKKCLGKMEDVAGLGKTVLFVSHNMAAVENLCSRGMLLNDGNILYSGDVKNTIHHYLSNIKTSRAVEISQYRRDKKSTISIEGVKLNSFYNKSAQINFGETLHFDLFIKANESFNSIYITLNIKAFDKTVLISSNSIDNELKYCFDTGNHCVSVSIPNLLMPGIYYIDIGLNGELSSRALEVLLNIPMFEILNIGESNLKYLPNRPGHLHITDVKWHNSNKQDGHF